MSYSSWCCWRTLKRTKRSKLKSLGILLLESSPLKDPSYNIHLIVAYCWHLMLFVIQYLKAAKRLATWRSKPGSFARGKKPRIFTSSMVLKFSYSHFIEVLLKFSYFHREVREWNNLPLNLRLTDSLGKFKSSLKSYLYSHENIV